MTIPPQVSNLPTYWHGQRDTYKTVHASARLQTTCTVWADVPTTDKPIHSCLNASLRTPLAEIAYVLMARIQRHLLGIGKCCMSVVVTHVLWVTCRSVNRNPKFWNSEIARIPIRYSDGQLLILLDNLGQTQLPRNHF